MIKIPEDHIQQYLKIFGTGLDQIDILQEECAELIKALGKYKRYGVSWKRWSKQKSPCMGRRRWLWSGSCNGRKRREAR